jgi:arsenate reductase
MAMKLYQYPKCSTCRKASKFLAENGVEFASIDITEHPPQKVELKAMLASYDGDIRKLFNTSGVQYRELNMKEKLPTMSENQAIDLLADNGKLIKRPFLLNTDRRGIVGFKQTDWENFI